MSEYRHTLSKTGLSSPTADPIQTSTNASGVNLDDALTSSNTLSMVVAGAAAYKLASNVGGAVIDQSGNANYDTFVDMAKDVAGTALEYGAAFGTGGPVGLVGYAAIDTAGRIIETTAKRQATSFENERIIKSRGVRRTSLGGYYG